MGGLQTRDLPGRERRRPPRRGSALALGSLMFALASCGSTQVRESGCPDAAGKMPGSAGTNAGWSLDAAAELYAKVCGTAASCPGTWWRPSPQSYHRVNGGVASQTWRWVASDGEAHARARVDVNARRVLETFTVTCAVAAPLRPWVDPGWTFSTTVVYGPPVSRRADTIGVLEFREARRWEGAFGPSGWRALLPAVVQTRLASELDLQTLRKVTEGWYDELYRADTP